jgi:hypothetical protein
MQRKRDRLTEGKVIDKVTELLEIFPKEKQLSILSYVTQNLREEKLDISKVSIPRFDKTGRIVPDFGNGKTI